MDEENKQQNIEENIETNTAESPEISIEEPKTEVEKKPEEPIQETKQVEQKKQQEIVRSKSSFFEDEDEKKPRQIFGEKLMKNMKMPSFKFNFNVKTWPAKIMHTLREYKRVFLVSKKPDLDELSEISKISIIGILLIGAIGFILQVMFQFFVK